MISVFLGGLVQVRQQSSEPLVKDLNVIYNLLRQHPDLSLPTSFTNSFSFLDDNLDDSGSGGIRF